MQESLPSAALHSGCQNIPAANFCDSLAKVFVIFDTRISAINLT